MTTQTVAEEKTLDAILEEALNIWKAWRADHRPPTLETKFNGTPWANMSEYEDDRYAAYQRAVAVIPTDKATLLAFAADDRVWEGASQAALETIPEVITGCVEWLIERDCDAYDKSVYGGS